jgi:hypothetical protein
MALKAPYKRAWLRKLEADFHPKVRLKRKMISRVASLALLEMLWTEGVDSPPPPEVRMGLQRATTLRWKWRLMVISDRDRCEGCGGTYCMMKMCGGASFEG